MIIHVILAVLLWLSLQNNDAIYNDGIIYLRTPKKRTFISRDEIQSIVIKNH
jgi:hypothetical protein